MHVCACTYICICAHMYNNVHICTRLYFDIHARVCVCAYACVYACMCVCVCVCHAYTFPATADRMAWQNEAGHTLDERRYCRREASHVKAQDGAP